MPPKPKYDPRAFTPLHNLIREVREKAKSKRGGLSELARILRKDPRDMPRYFGTDTKDPTRPLSGSDVLCIICWLDHQKNNTNPVLATVGGR